MIVGELKVQWGIVNAAHHDFSDVAQAVDWAQQEGYHTVYIPAGEYQLTSPISIYTPHFSLLGAGPGNTTLKFAAEGTHTLYAIQVQDVQGSTLIEGVRLADFTVQPLDDDPAPYEGGVHLVNCRRMLVERVHSKNWYSNEEQGHSFGFKADRQIAGRPAGGIVFRDCGVEDCFYGIWLTGDAPMQRCSLIEVSLKGVIIRTGMATGGGQNSLEDSGTNFEGVVQAGDWVCNLSDDSFGQVAEGGVQGGSLTLVERWQGGVLNTCQSGDIYEITSKIGHGVHIENAKGTLVLGGAVADYHYGVYVGPDANGRQTRLSQIISPKFDMVDAGVYVDEGADRTQVVAMTRAAGKDHVEDHGASSLVVGQRASGTPSGDNDSLWLTRKASQFRSNVGIQGTVDVAGLVDASVPNDRNQAGTVTRYGTGDGYNDSFLNNAFGHDETHAPLPDGFMGVYYDSSDPQFYLVTRADDQWKSVALPT